jgi:hypothetical protein
VDQKNVLLKLEFVQTCYSSPLSTLWNSATGRDSAGHAIETENRLAAAKPCGAAPQIPTARLHRLERCRSVLKLVPEVQGWREVVTVRRCNREYRATGS